MRFFLKKSPNKARCLNAFFTFATAARVVELVDTQDLKSCGHCGCTGSIPVPGTKRLSHNYEAVFFVYLPIVSKNPLNIFQG